MGELTQDDAVVSNPTYMGEIRNFFDAIDIDHMAAKGIDIGTYVGVKKNALAIYAHTHQPGGNMPPEASRKWSAARSQTFKNWILAGYPQGSATALAAPRVAAVLAPNVRKRRNISDLGQAEADKLKAAFDGVMARASSDANGYYAIASIHGLPQSYCLHHEDRFNPWHRVYLKMFEDALRSIPGCADVTLPYWDIATPIPDRLKQPPFDSYTVPIDLGARYGVNYKTKRFDQATIDANLAMYGVLGHIATALTQSLWGVSGVSGLQDAFIAAHDGGHVSIGASMADQNVSSFDPIFWFFHCNLDRIWLKWQTNVGALTLATFKSTLSDNTGWLSAPFNALDPFSTTADQTIAFDDIAYEEPAMEPKAASFENKVGSIDANRAFTISRAAPVSVLVKNIDRLNIPGSFVVTLLADGEAIAKRAFFQPNSPRDCANCRKLGLVNVNFRVDQEQILDRKLSIAIEIPGHEEIGRRFPLSAVGNPTINARLLIEDAM
jgi:tyrosinase